MIFLMLMGRSALHESLAQPFVRIQLPGPMNRFRVPVSMYPKAYAMLKVLGAATPNSHVCEKVVRWAHAMGITDEELDLFGQEEIRAAMRSFAQVAEIGSELIKVRAMSAKQAGEYLLPFLG